MKKIKILIPILLLLNVIAFISCKNDKNEPDDPLDKTPNTPVETPVEPIVKVNKELYFSQKDITQISFDTLNKYLAMDNIDTIFMIPQGTFASPNSLGLGYLYFKLARENLEPRTDLSPRIRGKGDYVTDPGHPSQALEDSLWFVSKGWTVNKVFAKTK
ncbi:MAG: hypothetical protein IJW01_04230 [Paludibacteraceae bacterium]|nr:hypothetical protein [Paludibacteraceae bacterium]